MHRDLPNSGKRRRKEESEDGTRPFDFAPNLGLRPLWGERAGEILRMDSDISASSARRDEGGWRHPSLKIGGWWETPGGQARQTVLAQPDRHERQCERDWGFETRYRYSLTRGHRHSASGAALGEVDDTDTHSHNRHHRRQSTVSWGEAGERFLFSHYTTEEISASGGVSL